LPDPLLLIDGSLTVGAAEPFAVVDPSTAELLAEVPAASPEQLDSAVLAAAAAFPLWRDLSQPQRSEHLHSVSEAFRSRRDDLADALTRETGRPRTRNLLYVDMAADLFRQYAEMARQVRGRVVPSNDPGQLSLALRVPFGVVAALVPWNYPLLLMAFKVAPALATGNTVVIKPASETTLVTLLFGEIFAACLPPGVVNIVAGSGKTIGEQLVTHPDVDLVAFTGSTEVGVRIGGLCNQLVRPAHLELGGKDPAIVFDDVDVALAARAVVWASFLNAGQVCTSTERVYVHESVHDRFVDEVTAITASLVVGDPWKAATQIGPMRNERGRAKVLDQIDEAVGSGATVLTGGETIDRPGFYLQPTVLVGVDHEMAVMRDETFGPVMPIMAFADEDEAVRLAADTPYGLGASAYTSDPGRARRLYERLPVGMMWINDPVVDNLAAPFGGMRASGVARELGLEGLEAFTVARHVHWNLELEHKPWWY